MKKIIATLIAVVVLVACFATVTALAATPSPSTKPTHQITITTYANGEEAKGTYTSLEDGSIKLDKTENSKEEFTGWVIEVINPDGSAAYSVTFPNDVEFDSLFYGAGFRFVDHDDNGNLVMSEELKGDRLETWYQTCHSLLFDNADVELLGANKANGFASGNVLFHGGTIADVQNYLQEVNFDFAVLPYPMYDDNQDNYRTITSYWLSMFSIPANAQDPAMSAAVLECLSSYGYRYLTPTLYQEAFQYRYLDTLENARMFDLLHNTLVFDPGRLFADQLSCFSAFRQAAQTSYTSWASYYATKERQWDAALENIIKTLG